MRIVLFVLVTLLLVIPSASSAQGLQMAVHPGFDGLCKEDKWMPVFIDLNNVGEEVAGTLSIYVENQDGQTGTTYLRPVNLGTRARQRVAMYIRNQNLPGRLQVKLDAQRGSDALSEGPVTSLSPEDRLIVVSGRERGALSFLSGTQQSPAIPQGTMGGSGGRMGGRAGMMRGPAGGSSSVQLRVADCDPGYLPDLPPGFAAVDILVIGDISAQAFRPETKDALIKWVQGGGTLVLTGGANWARLKDPFFNDLLPVEVAGSADMNSFGALASIYGASLSGAAVISKAALRPEAKGLVTQAGLPLVAEITRGSGRVIFLAFDVMQPPFRGWQGQTLLWNDLLGRAGEATPLVQAALSSRSNSYFGYGPYGVTTENLASAVLDIPSMKTPPFWWVAFFLGGYIILLVPVNYLVLKRKRRRELAWLTTPVIVILFSFMAYFIGYGMRGGRLIVNQLSVVEATAGAKAAAATSYAGVFSPARTAYDIGTDSAASAISEVGLERQGRNGKNLAVLETDAMMLSQVAMDMWSMRIFKLENLADLKQGMKAKLTLTPGRIVGQLTNHTGLDLTDCQLHLAGPSGSPAPMANLRDGETVKIDIPIGGGQPASVGNTRPYPGGGWNPGQQGQLRGIVERSIFGNGQFDAPGEVVFSGWCNKQFAGLTLDGGETNPLNKSLLIVHLPIELAGTGALTIPFGFLQGITIDEQGTNTGNQYEPGITITDGYVVRDYRLPVETASPTVQDMTVSVNFDVMGSGQSVNSSAQIYNWKSGAWDKLTSNPGRHSVKNPADHFKIPQGIVRLKFASHPAPGAQKYSSDAVRLTHLDVSMQVANK